MRFRFCVLCLMSGAALAADTPVSPLMAVLERFVAPGIPSLGPSEAAPIPRTWAEPAAAPDRPGRGLAQHPML